MLLSDAVRAVGAVGLLLLSDVGTQVGPVLSNKPRKLRVGKNATASYGIDLLGSEVIRENILSFVNACWVQPARASAPQQADTDGLGQSDSTHRTSVEVYRGWWWVRTK